MTITITPSSALTGLCGPNDANLRALEEVFGGRVSVRGNEIRIDGLDSRGEACFQAVADSLQETVRKGETPQSDYVRSLAAAALEETETESGVTAAFEGSIITIPGAFRKVFPKSANQRAYIRGLQKRDITFCVGPAGTGKTFLAIAWALHLVLTKKLRRLVLTRPVVEAGESLGFLPGDLAQKINPYLRPLYDAMESLVPWDTIRRMEENRIIEIAPLAYMRGRSLNDAVIILDEAQNTTKEQMKMFLTRLGSGSRAIITGDATQIDLPRRAESGLLHAITLLREIEGLHFAYLNSADVVRHPLIKRLIRAYEAERKAP